MNVGAKRFSTLAIALVLFALASSVVAVMVPRYFATGPSRPPFVVFLVAGIAMIALTALLFGYVDRLGMGFGRTALTLAAGYNALIATVKLGLAPAALYEANQQQSFDTNAGDPNSPWFYLAVGLTVLVLYVAVFGVMYAFFRWRFRRRANMVAASAERERRRSVDRKTMVVVLIMVGIIILSGLAVWWVPVFFVALPTLSYLSYIFSTLGFAILLALGMAAFLAFRTFDEVERRAVRLGDATLLASFFWFGLALIALYHVMWAVFLLALVSIWPFQTYTPK
jgi:hypothetical protein